MMQHFRIRLIQRVLSAAQVLAATRDGLSLQLYESMPAGLECM
jgi:hypothetical protein